jgi:sugar lactone lactonase YvrE
MSIRPGAPPRPASPSPICSIQEPAIFKHWVATFAGNGAAGSANGSFAAVQFNQPTTLASDAAGNLYVSDYGNDCIRKITPAGVVTLFAGQPGVPGASNGAALGAATFTNPQSVTFDPAGNMYVADYGNHCIRKIDTLGMVTTLAGLPGVSGAIDGTGAAARLWYPIGLIWHPSGVLYMSDRNDTVRSITPAGVVTTVAGTAGVHAFADGMGAAAQFNDVNDFAIAPNGDLLIADALNNRIRRMTTTGMVTTMAGTGVAGGLDGPAATATFDLPTGIAIAPDTTIYVTEFNGNRVRKLAPSGQVSLVAGSATAVSGFKDDLPASARFLGPRDVVIDPAGRIFVSDRDNHSIRHIRP